MSDPTQSPDTRQRLLEAAGPIFAEKGFRAATVKEICDAAGANIAAINYHFGDKQRLYVATLRFAHSSVVNVEDLRRSWPSDATASQKLGDLVRTLVHGILGQGKPAWLGRIIASEMTDPTDALDELVELEVRPKSQLLRQLIAEITGLPPHDERTAFNSLSIVSQCLFYHQNRAVVRRLFPGLDYDDENTVDRIADHITTFALRALQPPASVKGKSQRAVDGGRRR